MQGIVQQTLIITALIAFITVCFVASAWFGSKAVIRCHQRRKYGFSTDDEISAHEKMVDARDQQKPFSMTRWELNALRETTITHPYWFDEAAHRNAKGHDDAK